MKSTCRGASSDRSSSSTCRYQAQPSQSKTVRHKHAQAAVSGCGGQSVWVCHIEGVGAPACRRSRS
jgi:hypothetical protein